MTKSSAALVLLILAVGAGGVYLVLQNIKEAGYESCVLSIEGAFGKALTHDSELSRKIVVSNEWRTLDEEEERILFDKLIAQSRTFDCKQFGEYANGEALRGDDGSVTLRREGEWVRVRVVVDDGRTRRF